jgi:hypothetical protein
MKPRRHRKPPTRPVRLAALVASLLLAGCGGNSPTAPLSSGYSTSVMTPRVAKAALQRLKAPPGFRAGQCEFLVPHLPYTLCYRRNPFVPLNTATFAALITASGLTPDHDTLFCPRSFRPRPGAPITRDTCEARANTGSAEFAVSATSIKVRDNAIKPTDRELARTLRGTVYELTLVTTGAAS